MNPVPNNSLYMGFEIKIGQEFGFPERAVIFQFRHNFKIYSEIYPVSNEYRPVSEIFNRIGQICLRVRKEGEPKLSYFDFPPNENGEAGWFIE